jgi:hypothetical protein
VNFENRLPTERFNLTGPIPDSLPNCFYVVPRYQRLAVPIEFCQIHCAGALGLGLTWYVGSLLRERQGAIR